MISSIPRQAQRARKGLLHLLGRRSDAWPAEVNEYTLDTIVRTQFKAKRKVPLPSHTQKPHGHSCVSGVLW